MVEVPAKPIDRSTAPKSSKAPTAQPSSCSVLLFRPTVFLKTKNTLDRTIIQKTGLVDSSGDLIHVFRISLCFYSLSVFYYKEKTWKLHRVELRGFSSLLASAHAVLTFTASRCSIGIAQSWFLRTLHVWTSSFHASWTQAAQPIN